jgi:hypothetical protein
MHVVVFISVAFAVVVLVKIDTFVTVVRNNGINNIPSGKIK